MDGAITILLSVTTHGDGITTMVAVSAVDTMVAVIMVADTTAVVTSVEELILAGQRTHQEHPDHMAMGQDHLMDQVAEDHQEP